MKKNATTKRPQAAAQHPDYAAYGALPPPLQGMMRLVALLGNVQERALVRLCKACIPLPAGDNGVGECWSEMACREARKFLYHQQLLRASGLCGSAFLEHSLCCEAVQDAILVQAVDALITQESGPVSQCFALAARTRLHAYTGDTQAFMAAQKMLYQHVALCGQQYSVGTVLESFENRWTALPPEAEAWYLSRPPAIRLALLLYNCQPLLLGKPCTTFFPAMLAELDSLLAQVPVQVVPPSLILVLIFQAKFDTASLWLQAFLHDKKQFLGPYFQGMIAFFQGQKAEALPLLGQACKLYRREQKKRKIELPPPGDLVLALAMLATADPAYYKQLEDQIAAQGVHSRAWWAIWALLEFARGQEKKAQDCLENLSGALPEAPFEKIVLLLAEVLIREDAASGYYEFLLKEYQRLQQMFPLLAHLLAQLLARLTPQSTEFSTFMAHCPHSVVSLLDLLASRSTWERMFDTLSHVLCHGEEPKSPTATKRLVWLVDFRFQTLTPLEQIAKKNSWTSGRVVSFKRLYEDRDTLTFLSAQDRQILKALNSTRGWGGREFYMNFEEALPELVGHPFLLDAKNRRPLSLKHDLIKLQITEQGSGYTIGLSQPIDASDKMWIVGELRVVQQEADVYCLYQIPPKLQEIKTLLGRKKLHVPKAGAPRVLQLLHGIDPAVPLQATLSVVAECPALARPVVQVLPLGTGVKITLGVRPFDSPDSPFFPLGQGTLRPIAAIQGKTCRTTRRPEEERAWARQLLAACPSLQNCGAGSQGEDSQAEPVPDFGDDFGPWEMTELEEALAFLLEVKRYVQTCPQEGPPPLVEWPEGESLRVEASVSAAQLAVQIQHKRDWFQLQGQVQVNESLVLDMGKLLHKLAEAKGNFVPLGEGAFLALTQQFKRQLKRLSALSEGEKDGSRRIHPLGIAALESTLEGVHSLSVDAHWTRMRAQIRRAEEHEPALPSTLRADLRDYQREGFVWLSRLAQWATGACLADDMGLGKTVQTIALLLEHAPKGPLLVVAPTSVCYNWQVELERFAPTLQVHRLALGHPAARKEVVESMQAGDVLIISYGLLHTVTAILAARSWQVVVFDEAQALKNAATKRAKASKSIKAAFRLALTGTPIENYLEDLWSLFNTINPGLLGNLKSFQQRFGGPGTDARQALKALLRPFILRRTKSAVLTELPPRTEQVLQVPLPADEKAFYEALRRNALESLTKGEEAQGPGQRKLSILAALTRLRRACCHPSLIDPESPLAGAKLQAFLELVGDLRRGRHKALVFSQFVGHLSIVRRALEAQHVSYQYLDGATPEKERQVRVRAFQDGEGDVFLISLKAGGQGLNLTAADYVIHLDPWWNPAVEDQASDRAHRIGQKRPVTVYRLVIEDSVEEKILALHASKRHLASDFLEGTDSPLSEAELLALFAKGPPIATE